MNTLGSLEELQNEFYPKNCKIIKIKDYLTVRCGCFKTREDSRDSLSNLKQKYTDAYIRKTNKNMYEYAPRMKYTENKEKSVYEKIDNPLKNGNYQEVITIIKSSKDLKIDAKLWIILAKCSQQLGNDKDSKIAYLNAKLIIEEHLKILN